MLRKSVLGCNTSSPENHISVLVADSNESSMYVFRETNQRSYFKQNIFHLTL